MDTLPASGFEPQETLTPDSAFVRLWRGFMTARATIAIALLLLVAWLYALGPAVQGWLVLVSAAYVGSALAVRAFATPRPPGRTFDPQWASTIAVDIFMFTLLQLLQVGNINYALLLALPVLLASVMGSALLALGTAAGVTLLLLAEAWLLWLQQGMDAQPRFLQSGLTGMGFFAIAFLANQLAARLAREERAGRRSRQAARMQAQVNELVIETLADGVLVVDVQGTVRAANPAAHRLLGGAGGMPATPFVLGNEPSWQPLVALARQTFSSRTAQLSDIAIQEGTQGMRRVHVGTRLTATHESHSESLCVMFLQDLREMEARLRTERLAAMGRMSAAVAHEIRNPLAAITQANDLMAEDLDDPAHQQLSLMVRQNAQRLSRIVDEILDISRVQHQVAAPGLTLVPLDQTVHHICEDWAVQTRSKSRLVLSLHGDRELVAFDTDHLRRVLVNLLDNALRYAGPHRDSIQVQTGRHGGGAWTLQVWSDGAPLEQTVQHHLFEPFFSSESRSTGLGLYICRELCERHGAVIGYRRATRDGGQGPREGNEFFVTFRPLPALADRATFDKMTA